MCRTVARARSTLSAMCAQCNALAASASRRGVEYAADTTKTRNGESFATALWHLRHACDTWALARSAGDRRVRVPEPADQRCLPLLQHRVVITRMMRHPPGIVSRHNAGLSHMREVLMHEAAYCGGKRGESETRWPIMLDSAVPRLPANTRCSADRCRTPAVQRSDLLILLRIACVSCSFKV